MHISWGNRHPIDDIAAHNGYGYATERIVTALRDLGHTVTWQDPTADVHFHFDQPHHLKIPRKGMYSVMYHPWESTKLLPPGRMTDGKDWLAAMNSCDEVWSPSPLISDWYTRYMGITRPVHVFEHGVDADIWKPKHREFSESFRFLLIDGSAARKGAKEAMQGLRMAFPRNMDVQLTI